ncbi:deoxyribodipyrimidine photo-lyase [Bosea thiooxidans]
MMAERTLHWLRNDLRLADNPALSAAAQAGPVLCLYILDTNPARRPLGGASRWWLSRSLRALGEALAQKAGRLLLLEGDPAELIPRIASMAGIGLVTWNSALRGRGDRPRPQAQGRIIRGRN